MSCKLNLNRVPTKKLPLDDRKSSFLEVNCGFLQEEAILEANRCLQCKKPPCIRNCPVGVPIPDFIAAVRNEDFVKAAALIRSKNSLPAITGRVCPHEVQCEAGCVLAKKGAPLAIGALERFVATWEFINQQRKTHQEGEHLGYRVAVVGSGPGGLACAADLALEKYQVTVFEAMPVAGGVLTYGIPEFRLPKDVVRQEIDYVKSLGVEIITNAQVGSLWEIDELLLDFDAVFLALGADTPIELNVPGEDLKGVYDANDYLTGIALSMGYQCPQHQPPEHRGKNVFVIGGGNVAMDASRSALRLGAKEVTVVYRRTEDEMPANVEERKNAMEEGVNFMFLTTPVRFQDDGTGQLCGIELIDMALGPSDSSGRPRPVMINGSEKLHDADLVILALGNRPNPLVASATPGLTTAPKGTIKVDVCGKTTREGVWAGGDIVSGGKTVVSAMGAGKKAARDIDRWLKNKF